MKLLPNPMPVIARSEGVVWAIDHAKKACKVLRLQQIWSYLCAWQPHALVALGGLSALLTLITLELSSVDANWKVALGFLDNPLLFLFNWLPVALWMFFWYYALGKPFVAFGLTVAPVLALAFANYYKLRMRGDPLMFADLQLVGEASAMSRRYTIQPTFGVVMAILLSLLAMGVLRHQFHRRAKPTGIARLLGCAVCAALLFGGCKLLICSDTLYAQTALAVSWLPTESYNAHGVIYPFLRSVNDAVEKTPDGYDGQKAAAALAAYAESDIPQDRKVDVIGIMLEAFSDLSTVDNLDFIADPYADFHSLEAESYSGQLVTNIFAGETVNTERAFLTGYLDPVENFRAPLNSYVWYLRRHGYLCEGSHPGYNWFYNRININEYLGFEQYHYFEDRYRAYAPPSGITRDSVFLRTIIADYNLAKISGKPIFNFNVSYQNHGPYETTPQYATPYLPWKDGYNEADYNIANNYLSGIADTGRQLSAFVDHFRTEERPVVIVLFGDHKPWWGDGNSTYKMFGVNLDLTTEEGYYNYYTTPFLIWANDAAKKMLGNNFTGDGGRVSPAFLMEKLFSLAGWEGPAYMKAIRAAEAKTPFINRLYRLENGVLTGVNPDNGEDPEWLKQFRSIEYYQKHSAVITQ